MAGENSELNHADDSKESITKAITADKNPIDDENIEEGLFIFCFNFSSFQFYQNEYKIDKSKKCTKSNEGLEIEMFFFT